MASDPGPSAEYERRVRAAGDERDGHARFIGAVAWVRLFALVLLVGAAYEACGGRASTASRVALAGSLAVAIGLSIVIATKARLVARLEARRTYYQQGLVRLGDRWAEVGSAGDELAPDEHLFAVDLDLFGRHSLFARLSVARTSVGRATLASWLLGGAGRDEILARQAAVRELADALDLREALWQAGATVVEAGVRPQAVNAWLERPARPPRPSDRAIAAILGSLGVAAVALALAGTVWPLLALIPALVWFGSRHRALVAEVARDAQHRTDELGALATMIDLVAQARFAAPRLVALQDALRSNGADARTRIRELRRRVEWFESRRNPFFGVLSAPALASTQLAFAIELWRARHGTAAAGWLRTLGELEALLSLATYAHEHPELVFPAIEDTTAGPRFEAESLAHPLLPAATRVANDVALDPQARLLLVTGSNMSGKSTLLRAVGANAVLALAGAPVTAQRLRLTPFAIGASLRTSDSLEAGVSRFYAEIKRLGAVLELARRDRHTLYLLDEVLHGTNSHERVAGAEAIVRALVERGAIGLVTTHDLALAPIADALTPAARNVHFADVIEGNQVRFDYKLRPGVVPRGNALALMRMIGLPV